MIVAAALAGLAVTGFGAWVEVADSVEEEVFAAAGAAGVLGVGLVLASAAKEKFFTAVVGLFVPPVALVGALRLAKPRSLWARAFYSDAKRTRAEARYDKGD